jgi:ethanolamine permease
MENATIAELGSQRFALLRVVGPVYLWVLGMGIVSVDEYTRWKFASDNDGTFAALIICWAVGFLYISLATISLEVDKLRHRAFREANWRCRNSSVVDIKVFEDTS